MKQNRKMKTPASTEGGADAWASRSLPRDNDNNQWEIR